MTLLEIISSALEQQGKTSDAQVVHEWRDKFTQLANEGLADLAGALRLRRTDTIDVGDDGLIDIKADLPYECLKVIRITKDGKPVPFGRGPSTYEIRVPASGTAEIEYRYLPNAMTNDTDEPGIPNRLHSLLVNYVCGKDITTNDITTQSRSQQFYELYERGKLKAQKEYGEPEFYGITHKYE